MRIIESIILPLFTMITLMAAMASPATAQKKDSATSEGPDVIMEMKDTEVEENGTTEKTDTQSEKDQTVKGKKPEKKDTPAKESGKEPVKHNNKKEQAAPVKKVEKKPASDEKTEGAEETKKKAEEPSPAEEEEDELAKEPKDAQFKFKGLVKNLFTYHETDNFIERIPFNTVHKDCVADLTRVRLAPEFLYREMLNIKVEYDNEIIPSNYGTSMAFKNYWRPFLYNDFIPLTWEPYRGKEFYYRTKINRAYVKFNIDFFSATIGRQQIRFGSGKLWNPLDILNPISPTYIEGSDDQKGTDAVKLDFFPDDKTELSIIYDIKKSSNKIERFNMQDCNYILRVKTSIKNTDIAILGGYVTRRGLAGFDFASILFDGMLRGSLIVSQEGDTYYLNQESAKQMWTGKNERSPVYFQANVGYEYTFKKGVFFLVEYFYNQRAVNYNRDLKVAYTAASMNFMNQKTYLQLANQFLTINQHYVALALGYDFHPLVRGEFFTIGDIQGQGIFWSPVLKINAYENLDFAVGVMGAFVFNKKASDFSEFRKHYLYYASGTYIF